MNAMIWKLGSINFNFSLQRTTTAVISPILDRSPCLLLSRRIFFFLFHHLCQVLESYNTLLFSFTTDLRSDSFPSFVCSFRKTFNSLFKCFLLDLSPFTSLDWFWIVRFVCIIRHFRIFQYALLSAYSF